jgi:uncharacterized protein (TIGR00255 family)
MTGHGAARVHRGGVSAAIEVRTVNSRYYKLSVRATDGCASLEPRLDEVVRRYIRRGTVQVDLRVERDSSPDNFRLNAVVLASYQRQLSEVYQRLQMEESVRLESLLLLPGVVEERLSSPCGSEAEWETIEEALVQSLENLTQMRAKEGQAMAADLLDNCRTIAAELSCIEKRAPLVVENYRCRLTERLNRILSEYEVKIEPADVVREIGLFTERSDVSEEIVRLRSHLDQFQSTVQLPEGSGRKLEFVTQEMFREANTIGSKANDAEIACRVIEIKAAIERVREMIQNVE